MGVRSGNLLCPVLSSLHYPLLPTLQSALLNRKNCLHSILPNKTLNFNSKELYHSLTAFSLGIRQVLVGNRRGAGWTYFWEECKGGSGWRALQGRRHEVLQLHPGAVERSFWLRSCPQTHPTSTPDSSSPSLHPSPSPSVRPQLLPHSSQPLYVCLLLSPSDSALRPAWPGPPSLTFTLCLALYSTRPGPGTLP